MRESKRRPELQTTTRVDIASANHHCATLNCEYATHPYLVSLRIQQKYHAENAQRINETSHIASQTIVQDSIMFMQKKNCVKDILADVCMCVCVCMRVVVYVCVCVYACVCMHVCM